MRAGRGLFSTLTDLFSCKRWPSCMESCSSPAQHLGSQPLRVGPAETTRRLQGAQCSARCGLDHLRRRRTYPSPGRLGPNCPVQNHPASSIPTDVLMTCVAVSQAVNLDPRLFKKKLGSTPSRLSAGNSVDRLGLQYLNFSTEPTEDAQN